MDNIRPYMGTAAETDTMGRNRGFLTDRERQVLQGEIDPSEVQDLEQYRSKILSRVRKRAENAKEDIDIIAEGHPDVAEYAYSEVCGGYDRRLARVEAEMDRLQEEIEELRQGDRNGG